MIDFDIQKAPNGKTVLVVEDEEVLREMERTILETRGYNILEAESARKAFELWEEQGDKIDLLLTDVMLPRGISGFELARRLYNSRPKLKIIFTTGRVTRDVEVEAMDRMNAHFLPKPYEHTELVKVVGDALGEPFDEQITEPTT